MNIILSCCPNGAYWNEWTLSLWFFVQGVIVLYSYQPTFVTSDDIIVNIPP